MGELKLDYPFVGSRMMRDLLLQEDFLIGRLRGARLMMKMAIDAIHRRPNTSKPSPGHKVYPYLLSYLAIKRSDTAKGFVVIPAAGSSSEHWHGSTETAALPRTSSKPSPRQPCGCSSHPFSFSPGASQDHELMQDNFESDS